MSSRFQIDTSSFTRRDQILIAASLIIVIAVVSGLIIILAQGAGRPPAVQPGSATLTISPTAASFSPEPVGSPTQTFTPAPTPTLEPYQYTVQAGDTLGYIIQLFGYTDFSIVTEVMRLNNMPNEFPQEGQVLLIPRQTPTPGPSATPTIEGTQPGPAPDYSNCNPENRCVSVDGRFWIHTVRSGDTVLSIAIAYNSRTQDILQANGLGETSPIFPNQKLNIPILITLTPTLTPTGGPDSTATATPTISSPALLAPDDGSAIAGGQPVILEWLPVQPLADNQYYLIVLRNETMGAESRAVTRSNSYRLPDNMKPGFGGSITYIWDVVIVNSRTVEGAASVNVAGRWSFTWSP